MARKRGATEAPKAAPAADPSKPGPKPKLVYSEALLNQIRGLGSIQCTVEEIASVLHVSLRTLQYFFAEHPDAREAWEEGLHMGKVSLRRKMWNMADKSAPMLQWLSKQHLGMKEPVTQIETGKPGDFSGLTDEELQTRLAERARALAELDPNFVESVLGSEGRSASKTRH